MGGGLQPAPSAQTPSSPHGLGGHQALLGGCGVASSNRLPPATAEPHVVPSSYEQPSGCGVASPNRLPPTPEMSRPVVAAGGSARRQVDFLNWHHRRRSRSHHMSVSRGRRPCGGAGHMLASYAAAVTAQRNRRGTDQCHDDDDCGSCHGRVTLNTATGWRSVVSSGYQV